MLKSYFWAGDRRKMGWYQVLERDRLADSERFLASQPSFPPASQQKKRKAIKVPSYRAIHPPCLVYITRAVGSWRWRCDARSDNEKSYDLSPTSQLTRTKKDLVFLHFTWPAREIETFRTFQTRPITTAAGASIKTTIILHQTFFCRTMWTAWAKKFET